MVHEITQLLFHGVGLGLVPALLTRQRDQFLHLVHEQRPGPASEADWVIRVILVLPSNASNTWLACSKA